MDSLDHLFRHQSGRMVSTLTRVFGLRNLALAEDVVQDSFRSALEVWKHRGVPPNPEAWLLTAARNKAIDALRRERTAKRFAPELLSEWTLASAVNNALAEHGIEDDQLRLMFTCCDPRLKWEAQVALILNSSADLAPRK